LQYTEMAGGVWFPIGGLYRVIESLVSIAQAHGVKFIYDAPVKRIEVEGNRATAVILNSGSRLDADVIVANADLPYVYRELLPDRTAAERLEHLKYTCSALMFYWGVDQVYPQLGMHNVFLSGDYRASFDRIFHDHTLPEAPSFYVHAPARTDPSAAPLGQDTLFVLVPVGHLDDHTPQDWEALKARARAAVLDRLSQVGVRDLEEHLKFEVSFGVRPQPQLYASRLSAPTEPAPSLPQPLLCRRKHTSRHGLAHRVALCAVDHRAHFEPSRRASSSVPSESRLRTSSITRAYIIKACNWQLEMGQPA
jgi:phytoene desaturase